MTFCFVVFLWACSCSGGEKEGDTDTAAERPVASEIVTDLADVVIRGSTIRTSLGRSVSMSSGADFSLILGSPGRDSPAVYAGGAHLFGWPLPSGVLVAEDGLTVEGLSMADWFGYSVAHLDNWNGGAAIAVSAPRINIDEGAGYAAVLEPVHGADLLPLDGWLVTWTGGAVGDQFGYALASNEVGRLVVGAPIESESHERGGGVYLFGEDSLGGLAIDNARARLSPASEGDHLGHSLASAGDVAGDGVPRWIAGAPFENTNGFLSGAAYLWPDQGGVGPVSRTWTLGYLGIPGPLLKQGSLWRAAWI